MSTAIDELRAAIDGVARTDPGELAGPDTLAALHRELERLEAVTTRAVGAFDSARGYVADGAHSAAAWIAVACRLPRAVAHRRVRLGRALAHLPHAEAAWVGGDIGSAHVARLDAVRTPHTAGALARDEAMLVGHAVNLRFAQFARVVAYWEQHADPDGCEQRAQARHDARRLHLSQGFLATWHLDALFDPVGGEIVSTQLGRITEELFAAEWAEAKARVGEGVTVADLARTPAQRRADALVEMARRSAAMAPGSRLPEPLFTVVVGYETFAGRICELASGTVLTPGSVLAWLDSAWVERVVFDGPSRVIDVGVRRRLYSGATRRAVLVRDRECFHEWCETAASDCEVDHVVSFGEGGLTTEANGRAACGFHNRQRHRRR